MRIWSRGDTNRRVRHALEVECAQLGCPVSSQPARPSAFHPRCVEPHLLRPCPLDALSVLFRCLATRMPPASSSMPRPIVQSRCVGSGGLDCPLCPPLSRCLVRRWSLQEERQGGSDRTGRDGARRRADSDSRPYRCCVPLPCVVCCCCAPAASLLVAASDMDSGRSSEGEGRGNEHDAGARTTQGAGHREDNATRDTGWDTAEHTQKRTVHTDADHGDLTPPQCNKSRKCDK